MMENKKQSCEASGLPSRPMICSVALWQASGQIPVGGEVAGICRTCGAESSGVKFEKWVKDTFTNHDILRRGEIVCQACLFCFEEQSQLLAEKVGKEKPQKMRNFSHFVADGKWFPLSKADKSKMLELLREKPQVAVLADSGQKHLIFRARPGWWQFEEIQMLPNLSALENCLVVIETLYQGFTKDEIKSGNYAQRKILSFGAMGWRKLEEKARTLRGSACFDLGLFLSQKENL